MKRSREINSLISIGIVGLIILFGAPLSLDLFSVISLTTAISLAILALSLGLIWGFGGILCFGQTAFFGIGGYAYAIAALNFGGSTGAIIAALLVAAAAAAILGYFMFYGRLSDVYLAVITLTVTLILYSVIRRTSGPEYKIGIAKLGGFNGINVPPINYPWDATQFLYPEHVFYVAMVALLLAYFLCVWLIKSHFGRVCVSIRENEVRTELLGYDIRFYKLCMFTVGGAIAGLGGIMFANSIGRITPDVFNLYNAALAIIWVIIGGRGTLIGPVFGALILFYLTSFLGRQAIVNINLFLGLVLIIFVLVVPKGIVPSLVELWDRRKSRRMTARSARRMRRRGRS
ncbi:MAG: branched-chain amino acid ABC transporter permease, partial [Dehalococcoidia bacterium]|nr:branched-chain amino acid ABC transporter permease [Dehalococcoidia bacterium]